jgi:fucose 4-O-acetylase-like acetyltransferase
MSTASTTPTRPGVLPAPRPRPVGARPAPSPRDPWFDNAKMLLVTLVVVGHAWTLLPDTVFNDRLYDWLYLWHMPAFVMVTGYLSKRFTYSRRHLRRLVTTVAIPYVVFEGAMALFRVQVGGETLERLWLNPHWPMWYLAALFFWRLATPALRRLPLALPVAVGVSLLGGVVGTEILDVNRVLGMLPFFVIGLLAERRHLDVVRSQGTRTVGLAVLASAVLLTGWVHDGIGTEWLYYRTSYADLDLAWWQGMVIRLVLIGVAVAMTVSALAWLPRTKGWFTRMGAASLVVYLFHGFAVKVALYAGASDWAAGRPVTSLVVVTVLAVLVALGLAWRPVATKLEKVVTPAP